jgi:hypothetical protein
MSAGRALGSRADGYPAALCTASVRLPRVRELAALMHRMSRRPPSGPSRTSGPRRAMPRRTSGRSGPICTAPGLQPSIVIAVGLTAGIVGESLPEDKLYRRLRRLPEVAEYRVPRPDDVQERPGCAARVRAVHGSRYHRLRHSGTSVHRASADDATQ